MRKSHTTLATEKLAKLGFSVQPSNSDHTNRYILKQTGTPKFWGVRTLKEAVKFASNYVPADVNIRAGNVAH